MAKAPAPLSPKAGVSAPDRAKDPGDAKEHPDMSPNSVNNFVSDLVVMAQAVEELPKVKEQLDNALTSIGNYQNTVNAMAADLEQSRSYAASLEAKVHAAEASRDDAELRFLELDEKVHNVLDRARASAALMEGIERELDPPKHEPVVDHEAEALVAKPYEWPEPIVSEVRAIDNPLYDDPQVSEVKPIAVDGETLQWHGSLEADAEADRKGQSEADPTATQTDGASLLDSATSMDAGNIASWGTPTPPKSQPYVGICYHDWPKYVSLTDWLDGGGTEQNYYY